MERAANRLSAFASVSPRSRIFRNVKSVMYVLLLAPVPIAGVCSAVALVCVPFVARGLPQRMGVCPLAPTLPVS